MKRIAVFLFAGIFALISFLTSQEIIQNPEKLRSPKAGRVLEIEEIFRITDESGDFFFKHPSQLKIAEDGSIFLTDEDQFLKFTADGKYLKNILKKGQGPGEIQSQFFYYHLKGKNIYVYDPSNSKIIIMDQEGMLIEELRLKERFFQFIGLWKDNFIFSKYIWPGIEEQTGRVFNIPIKIFLLSKEGAIINECYGIPMKRFLHQNISVGFPRSASIISENGEFCYISDDDEYMVSVLDIDKLEFIRKFKRDYPRVRRRNRKKSSHSLIKIPEKKYVTDIEHLYNFKENLWVETSTDDDKKGRLFDVFNQAGQYIDCFWLESGKSLVTAHGDYLFIREQDEDGSMRIVKYGTISPLISSR